jgi:hypothetical protein
MQTPPTPADGAVHPAATLSTVAWTPNGDLAHREWVAAGRRLGSISRCSKWWIGDWLRYGTVKWGEKYVEAAKITGYDPKSLRNIAYIASRFDLSRRRDNLSWSHHADLAMLAPTEQDEWLDRTIRDRLSVSDLRTELRSRDRGSKAADNNSAAQPSASVTCPNCGSQVLIPDNGPSPLASISRTPAVAA